MKRATVAILRVSGPDLNVDEFLAAQRLAVDRVWRRGESRRAGEVQSDSGFSATIAEVTSEVALRQAVASFLERARSMTASLAAARAHAELDVGLMLDAGAPMSVGFPPHLLAALASSGIAVRVTAYPCRCEDADANTR